MADKEPTMNTQQRMDEALDQFNEPSSTHGKTNKPTTTTTTTTAKTAGKTTKENTNKRATATSVRTDRHQNRKSSKTTRKNSTKKHSHGHGDRKKSLKKKGSDRNLSLSPLPEPTMKMEESHTTSNWGLNDQSVTSVNNSGRRVRQYRLTLVGYSKVGKTALCSQFCENKFKNDYPRHKELLFKKKIDLPEMPTYRFMVDILDTQGAQEVKNREIVMEDRYRKRTNHIMLFVFSITNDKSFKFIEELLRIEYESDSEYFEKQGVVIVGNKCDLMEDREVETADARELARDYGAAYFEASAKTRTNVDKAFYEAIRKYHEKSGELEETMEAAKPLCPGCIIL